MGFLDKLFKKSVQTTERETPSVPQQHSCKTEEELLELYGGIALEKQLDFGGLIGENNWNVNMQTGTLSFGDALTFPIQVLGTFSHSSETWLWSWANEKAGLSEHLMHEALKLKKYGEENGIDLLRNSTFDFSGHQLHMIGIIASEMSNADAYYIADYGAGAMVVTLTDDRIKIARNNSTQRVMTIFPQLISQFDLNHHNALKEYLSAKGYQITKTTGSLEAIKDGNIITAEFDELFRLKKLNGEQ